MTKLNMAETLTHEDIADLRKQHCQSWSWAEDEHGPIQECAACGQGWPCDFTDLLATFDRLRGALEAIQANARSWYETQVTMHPKQREMFANIASCAKLHLEYSPPPDDPALPEVPLWPGENV